MAPTEPAVSPPTPPLTEVHGSPELLSKLRHDLKTPLNQIIGYGEMLLEDAEAAGSESVIAKLKQLLETARSCLDVQSRLLMRPVEEITAQIWRELKIDQTVRTSFMSMLLSELRLEPDAQESAADLDKLSLAVSHLENLACEASVIWDRAGKAEESPDSAATESIIEAAQPEQSATIEVVAQPHAPPERNSQSPAARMLVVEDNEINRDMLNRRLEREGYSVTLAANGRQALEIMDREPFDLVLLDIMMPELDGFTVLQRMRANPRLKETAVIMISALDEIASVVRCIEMGAEDYLPKPFDPVLLRARIGALLERKRLRDEERLRAVRLEAAFREADLQKQAAEQMLRNILPDKVASELQERGTVEPMYFEDVTIGFTDFVGFTRSTEHLAAEELVGLLHEYFTAFDRIMARYGLEKMKTIGDSYMFVSGMPERRPSHPVDAVLAALEMVEVVKNLGHSAADACDWKVRIGLHSGPVIAGVVGIHKFAFDIWGDSVNFASRMESSSEANRVNLSERTYARVKDFVRCSARGRIKTKDGREVDMFFADGVHEKLLDDRGAAPPPAFSRRYKIYFQKEPGAFPEFLLQQS